MKIDMHRVKYKEKFDPSKWQNLYGEFLRPYAKRNFKGFVSILFRLLKEKKVKFDLIVGAGNSGSGMIALVELICKHLRLPVPLLLRIPIQRYVKPTIIWSDKPSDYYDNTALLPEMNTQLQHLKLTRILYVDDETSFLGLTVKNTVDLIKQSNPTITDKTVITIVSEDATDLENAESFKCRLEIYSWAKQVEKLYSVLFYVLPYAMEQKINKSLGKKLEVKMLVCALLDAPLRKKVSGTPKFSFEVNEMFKNEILNFKDLQKQFQDYLKGLINEGINDYRKGKILIK